MFTVGMRLTPAQLAAAFAAPRALLAGLAAQMAGLPLLALAISALFSLPPPLAAGLLVAAIAPGGITSNYVTMLARGDAALSTAMTLVTTLAAVVTIPALLLATGNLPSGDTEPFLVLGRMGLAMLAMTALPLIGGMAFQARLGRWAIQAGPILDHAAKLVFAAIVGMTFYQNWGAMGQSFRAVGGAVAALNLSGMACAALIGVMMQLSAPQRLAIIIETGLQNAAMAIVVAGTLLGQPSLAIPALIYAVIMNITAAAILLYTRKAGVQAAA
jgi:BASS family bile acid:Na+ symporter